MGILANTQGVKKFAKHQKNLFINYVKIVNISLLHSEALIKRPPRKKPDFVACKQQRPRPACASVQSDQLFCYLFSKKYKS